MITISILAAAYAFLEHHQGDIASKMVASAGYDLLKKSLNFTALKAKLKDVFKKDDQKEAFIKELCDKKIDVNEAPQAAVKDIYENITGETYTEQVFELLKEWISENKEPIQNLNNISISNSSGFNIGVQNAQGNIFNVQGDYKVNSKNED